MIQYSKLKVEGIEAMKLRVMRGLLLAAAISSVMVGCNDQPEKEVPEVATQTENEHTVEPVEEDTTEEVVLEPVEEVEQESIEDTILSQVTVKLNTKVNGTESNKIILATIVENKTGRDIKGIQGTYAFNDMFGEEIMEIEYDLVSDNPITEDGIGLIGSVIFEYNSPLEKIYDLEMDQFEAIYTPTMIIFEDGEKVVLNQDEE